MNQPNLLDIIREDWNANSHIKSKVILLLFRLAHAAGTSKHQIIHKLSAPYRLFYRLLVDWIMGIDIPWKVKIGRRPTLYHSFGLVINEAAVIGDDCILRHAVTIGNKLTPQGESRSPVIGNGVEFGAGAIVLGALTIGDRSIIGAAAVVTKDVPSDVIVVGNPARILDRR